MLCILSAVTRSVPRSPACECIMHAPVCLLTISMSTCLPVWPDGQLLKSLGVFCALTSASGAHAAYA